MVYKFDVLSISLTNVINFIVLIDKKNGVSVEFMINSDEKTPLYS